MLIIRLSHLRIYLFLSLFLLSLHVVRADKVRLAKGEKYELRIYTITHTYDPTEQNPILQKSVDRDLYEFEVREAHRKKGYLLEMRHLHSSQYSFLKRPGDPLWYENLFWESDILTPEMALPVRGEFSEKPFMVRLTAGFQLPDSLAEKDWYTPGLTEAFASGWMAAYRITDTCIQREYPEGIYFMADRGTPHYHIIQETRQETRFTRIDTIPFMVTCGEDEKQTVVWARTNTRIRGTICKPGNLKSIPLQCAVDFPEYQKWVYELPLHDGQFEFRINLEQPISFVTLGGRYNLYLEPGDDLTLTIDTLDGERQPEFAGLGAGNNRYFAGEGSHWGYSLYGLKEENSCSRDYYKALDKRAEGYRRKMEAGKADFTLGFYQYMTDEFKYRPVYQKLMNQRDTTVGPFDCITGVEICNPLALSSGSYLSVLRHCMWFVMPKRLSSVTQAWTNYQSPYDQAVALLDGKVLNVFLVKMIAERLKSNFKEGKKWYERYKRDYVRSPYTAELDRIFEAAGRLAPGNPAPDFTLRDTTGREVSLSDFRGKVVYIDFWGTGCGPCMYEFKHAAPGLEEYFEGKEVVFLNISNDRREQTWKKTITDFQIQGVNLLDTKDRKVSKLYRVSGIPHYVLIGKDGKIIDAHAPRPSMNVKQAIEEALRED